MISIQTNYAAMVGEQNLNTNNTFQTKTIEPLTSGYRINSSGDDPAGLAVANQYAADVAQLTQGVINGNSGVSTLQIIDGGLSNISTMLDRMKTLATESASSTFTGNRATVEDEFQTLLGEIDREAGNIGLGGSNTRTPPIWEYISAAAITRPTLRSRLTCRARLSIRPLWALRGSVDGGTNALTVGAINLNSTALLLKGRQLRFSPSPIFPAVRRPR